MGRKIIELTFCFSSVLGCRLLNLLLVSSASRAPPEWRYEDQITLPRPAIVTTVFSLLLHSRLCTGEGGLASLPCPVSCPLHGEPGPGSGLQIAVEMKDHWTFKLLTFLKQYLKNKTWNFNNLRLVKWYKSKILVCFLHCLLLRNCKSVSHQEDKSSGEWSLNPTSQHKENT